MNFKQNVKLIILFFSLNTFLNATSYEINLHVNDKIEYPVLINLYMSPKNHIIEKVVFKYPTYDCESINRSQIKWRGNSISIKEKIIKGGCESTNYIFSFSEDYQKLLSVQIEEENNKNSYISTKIDSFKIGRVSRELITNSFKEKDDSVSVINFLKNNVWKGVGFELDGKSWEIKVFYKNRIFFTSYPSLSCKGKLKYLSRISSTNKAIFDEHIIEGKKNCLSGLRTVITKINEDTLKFKSIAGTSKISRYNSGDIDHGAFSGINYKRKVLSEAKLTRENTNQKINSEWLVKRNLHNALGNTYLNGRGMSIDFSVNNKGNNPDKSSIYVYKKDNIKNRLLKDYYLHINIDGIYGGSNGHPIKAGCMSSGVSGIYSCFLDGESNKLGCLAWTDHTNRFIMFHSHNYSLSELFYATELNTPFRRAKTGQQTFILDVNLLDEIKNKLPELYTLRNNIRSIEYGAFVGEASKGNICYKCVAGITFSELRLYNK